LGPDDPLGLGLAYPTPDGGVPPPGPAPGAREVEAVSIIGAGTGDHVLGGRIDVARLDSIDALAHGSSAPRRPGPGRARGGGRVDHRSDDEGDVHGYRRKGFGSPSLDRRSWVAAAARCRIGSVQAPRRSPVLVLSRLFF